MRKMRQAGHVHSTYGGAEKYIQGFDRENIKERDHLESKGQMGG
jgi:hypothetical protein